MTAAHEPARRGGKPPVPVARLPLTRLSLARPRLFLAQIRCHFKRSDYF